MKARILAALFITLASLTGCIKGSKQFIYGGFWSRQSRCPDCILPNPVDREH